MIGPGLWKVCDIVADGCVASASWPWSPLLALIPLLQLLDVGWQGSLRRPWLMLQLMAGRPGGLIAVSPVTNR